jgi:hypothetical protein
MASNSNQNTEKHNSGITLFWEDIEDEPLTDFVQIDHGSHISIEAARHNAVRTLFSRTFESSEPIDMDDLFNTDCFFESPNIIETCSKTLSSIRMKPN